MGNEKTSFACILSGTANGEKLKPLIIFIRKIIPKGTFPKDVVIWGNPKGCMCEDVRLEWLEEAYCKCKGVFFSAAWTFNLGFHESSFVGYG